MALSGVCVSLCRAKECIPVAQAVELIGLNKEGLQYAITVHGGEYEILVTEIDNKSVEISVDNMQTGDRFACTTGSDSKTLFSGNPPPPLNNPEQLALLLRDALSWEAGHNSIPYACLRMRFPHVG